MDKEKKEVRDYFIAALSTENSSIEMEPHCGRCDGHLNEDYYCEICRRNCLCLDIFCSTEEVFERITKLINEQPRFKKFKAFLGKKK